MKETIKMLRNVVIKIGLYPASIKGKRTFIIKTPVTTNDNIDLNPCNLPIIIIINIIT